MTKRVVVLVTGVGACGVGEGVAKAVMAADRYELVAVNADANAPALYMADHRYIVPRAPEPGYEEAIIEICRRHDVGFVLPGSEPEVVALSRAREKLNDRGIKVIVSPLAVVETFQDKWRTFEFLTASGLPTPDTIRPLEAPSSIASIGYPFILKPRFGHASQDVYLVRSPEEASTYLDYFARKHVEPIAQQYLAGTDEFTCSALIGETGEILGSIAMKRSLMGGFSQQVVVEDYPEARSLTESAAHRSGGLGPINVQCRSTEGNLSIFEINARFSGSAPFRAMAGFNEPDIMIQHLLNPDLPPRFAVHHGLVGMRRLEEVLVDEKEYFGIDAVRAITG